jgi:hypothetical protein
VIVSIARAGLTFRAMQVQDLTRAYQAKTDEELLHLASDSGQLTPEAHSALTVELTRRRLGGAEHLNVIDARSSVERTSGPLVLSVPDSQAVGEFVEDVLRLYRRQFWLFIKLIAPAVVVGYIAVFTGRTEAREIARHLPRGYPLLSHQTEIIAMLLANLAGYVVSWMAFAVSFGAICSAVGEARAGGHSSVAKSFAAVRERGGSFVRLSLLLFFVVLLAMGGAGLVTASVFWALRQGGIHGSRFTILFVSYGLSCLALLIVSRFGLAMPSLILDDCPVFQSIFRSDELTEGKWLTLAVLLTKSLIGGYIAGMAPFWLASLTPIRAALPSWFPWILVLASIAGVALVEPTMFIGFALLYSRMSTLPRASAQ